MATEKRLIDANALKEQIAKEIHTYWTNGTGGYYIAEDVIPDIDNAPTVDAVEVPCELGHIVFFVCTVCDEEGQESLAIAVGEIVSFSIQKEGLWAYCRYESGLTYWHKVNKDFGKTVFLTKAEAEAELTERREGE